MFAPPFFYCAGRCARRPGFGSSPSGGPVRADAAHKLHESSGGGGRGDLARHERQASRAGWLPSLALCCMLCMPDRCRTTGACPLLPSRPAAPARRLPSRWLGAHPLLVLPGLPLLHRFDVDSDASQKYAKRQGSLQRTMKRVFPSLFQGSLPVTTK